MGGAIAAQMALAAPQRVASLVLIASAGLGAEINAGYIEGFVAAATRRELKPVVEQLFADPALVSRQMLDDLLKYKRLDGVSQALTQLGGVLFGGGRQAAQPVPQLAGSGLPMQVVWGREDRIIPAAHAANAPAGATVQVLDGAGHMVMMEKAGEVNALHPGAVEEVAAPHRDACRRSASSACTTGRWPTASPREADWMASARRHRPRRGASVARRAGPGGAAQLHAACPAGRRAARGRTACRCAPRAAALVPQGPGLLNLSLVWRAEPAAAPSGTEAIYRALCDELAGALARLGIAAAPQAVAGLVLRRPLQPGGGGPQAGGHGAVLAPHRRRAGGAGACGDHRRRRPAGADRRRQRLRARSRLGPAATAPRR